MAIFANHKGHSHQSPNFGRRGRGGKGSVFAVLLVVLLAFLNWWTERPEHTEGRVLHVQDGDSFVMMREGERVTVRLFAIDCPEKNQPYAAAAKAFTGDLIEGREVQLEVRNTDRYDRLISQVYLDDGRCLNHELVGAGLAWWYRRHAPDDRTLPQLEQRARSGRAGLWAEADPTAPWDFRNEARSEASTR